MKRFLAAAGIIAAAAISAAILLVSNGNSTGLRRPRTLPRCTPGYTLTPSQVAGTGSPHAGSGLDTTVQSAPAGTVICLAAGNIRTSLNNAHIWLDSATHRSNVVIRPAPGATVDTGCWTLAGVNGLTIEGFTGPSETGGATIENGPGAVASKNILITDNVIGRCPTNVVTSSKKSNIVFSYDTFDNYSANGINTANTNAPDVQVTNNSPYRCPQEVLLTHNTVLGYAPKDGLGPNGARGNPDGVDLSAHACGDRFTYNYLKDLTQDTDANANHTDAFQDLGAGGPDNLIKGNWMTGVADCFLAADNDRGLTYTDNVCSVSGALYYLQCGGCVNDTFDHNTLITAADAGNARSTPPYFGPSHPVDGSLPTSALRWTNNLQVASGGGSGASIRSNPAGSTCAPLACTFDYNFETPRPVPRGHNITSGMVRFVGGATPSSFAGYALSCPKSPGCGAASDGKNVGADNFSVLPGSGIPGP